MNKIKLTTARLFVAAFLLCLSMTLQTQAAPGDLDPSFGDGGRVVTPIGNGNEGASAVAIQSDGKIVAAGGSYNGANNRTSDDFELARYNTDGSLDISFGTGGKVVTPIGNRAGASAVAIQTDGKIVAAGFAEIGNIAKFTLARYNTDGSLDTTFGTGGIIQTLIGEGSYASAVAIQADGKIVAAGSAGFGDIYVFALVRYNTNGSLDASFGTGGIVTTQFYFSSIQSSDVASAVAIQADGKIVAAGLSDLNDYGNLFALARYNTDGSLDTSFGAGGKVTTSAGSSIDSFSDVTIQSDGKIVAVGSSYIWSNGSIGRFTLARYNTNGSLDTTFGTGGKVLTLVGESSSARAVAIQSDEKIVAAGYSRIASIGSIGKFALARYNTNGSLDTTFGTNGIVVTPIGNGGGASAVAIQSDGRIVAAGSCNNGTNNDFALARYLSDSNTRRTQFDFDGDGKADVSVFRPSNGTWYLQQSTSGFTGSQFGIPNDKLVPADYDGDGKTDIAVFRDGVWYWLNSSNGNFNAFRFGIASDIPVPADFTGDGRAELAVYRAGIWYSLNLTNNQFQSVQFGNSTDKPVTADYDGDGRADQAVYRSGVWYLLKSTEGFGAIQFGFGTDKPVQADYDGDGKTDFAVFRPSDGNWYLRNSASGNVQIVNWGLGTDALVPADYDGDGKADVAVFRDGFWYIRQTTGAINYAYFGLGSDTPTNQVQ